jgi:hypothetical protein
MKARLADLGGDVLALSPADFGKLIADETEPTFHNVPFCESDAAGRVKGLTQS